MVKSRYTPGLYHCPYCHTQPHKAEKWMREGRMVYQVALKPKSLARSGISKGGVGRSGGRVKGLLSQLASPRRQLPPVEDSVPLVWGGGTEGGFAFL
jgi:hypothetical protein